MIYFTSDLHLGHKNCIAMCCRPFDSVDEMDRAIISRWNGRVKNSDTVYVLGDMLWESADPKKYLSRLKGKKVLIAGNHDTKWLKRGGMAVTDKCGRVEFCDYSEYFTEIAQYLEISINGAKLTLCHYPMLEWRAGKKLGSKKVGYLIHGHTHNRTEPHLNRLFMLPNALNAGVDINGFLPVTFDELVANNEAFKLRVLQSETDRAEFVASKYHMFQTDRSGKPYIEHPRAVAAKLSDPTAKAVALLHDVLEDTDINAGLLERNFSPEVVEAVKLLTRKKTDDYFEYVKRLSVNPLARTVKLADLEHNSDLSRLKVITQADIERNKKYKKAREIIESYMGEN